MARWVLEITACRGDWRKCAKKMCTWACEKKGRWSRHIFYSRCRRPGSKSGLARKAQNASFSAPCKAEQRHRRAQAQTNARQTPCPGGIQTKKNGEDNEHKGRGKSLIVRTAHSVPWGLAGTHIRGVSARAAQHAGKSPVRPKSPRIELSFDQKP